MRLLNVISFLKNIIAHAFLFVYRFLKIKKPNFMSSLENLNIKFPDKTIEYTNKMYYHFQWT